ncbi:hypothetical protein PRIPAC_88536 [Pristionchus pacificus]|uniref:Uncharacterized protein n=1 Tax=Pristionchus pacificus TaxID=54126 RepID=A0A2A6CYN3_PRIPA|nr:hypothetical protein PRIPAC_88536 [Pristionchus pacificus]|eukprot:PDM83322.1 hypothetical protein PRIPAC_34954 [Pristionchus pacificus]
MCGGKKKVSTRDPFPPSNIPSQRVLPPSASPSPTLPPYSNIERWEGDHIDLSSANDSEGANGPMGVPESSWLMRMNKSSKEMYDTIDNTDKKDDTGTKGYEIDKKWKDIGKKKGESDLQMNQSGARYGHMSGASHREYHSIEDIEKMEKEAAKKKGVYGKTLDMETCNQSGARYGVMNGSHREYSSLQEISEILEKSEVEKKKKTKKTLDMETCNQIGARYGSMNGSHREYASLDEISQILEESENERKKKTEKMSGGTSDSLKQTGARYGSMSEAPNREYVSIEKTKDTE